MSIEVQPPKYKIPQLFVANDHDVNRKEKHMYILHLFSCFKIITLLLWSFLGNVPSRNFFENIKLVTKLSSWTLRLLKISKHFVKCYIFPRNQFIFLIFVLLAIIYSSLTLSIHISDFGWKLKVCLKSVYKGKNQRNSKLAHSLNSFVYIW